MPREYATTTIDEINSAIRLVQRLYQHERHGPAQRNLAVAFDHLMDARRQCKGWTQGMSIYPNSRQCPHGCPNDRFSCCRDTGRLEICDSVCCP